MWSLYEENAIEVTVVKNVSEIRMYYDKQVSSSQKKQLAYEFVKTGYWKNR
jgi:hypothetical protein